MSSRNKKKKTLAFVDHSFHKKSHSGDFLRELFQSEFNIINYWDEKWEGGRSVSVSEINQNDFAFYFQVLNSPSELLKIDTPILWAPMYDGVKFYTTYWNVIRYSHVTVIAFSKKISDWCATNMIPCINAQYFIAPNTLPMKQGKHIFFWYRGGINFDSIRTLLGDTVVDSFIYLSNSDPHSKPDTITDADIKKYNIQIINKGFLSQNEYRKLVQKANIYITPRKKEGIGMSFLEALSYGHVVIGYDEATLNEYIIHNKTGYLFNDKDVAPIDFSNLDQIRKQSIFAYQAGFEKWSKDKKEIIPFLMSQTATRKKIKIKGLFWSLLHTIIHLYRGIKFKLFTILRII